VFSQEILLAAAFWILDGAVLWTFVTATKLVALSFDDVIFYTDNPQTEIMARKSQRLSAGTATVLPSHKRAASNTSLPSGDAKKSRTKKATPTKSQYFSKDAEDSTRSSSRHGEDERTQDEGEEVDSPSAPEEDLSEFGSASESDNAEDDDGDDDEEYESADCEGGKPKSRKKATSTKATAGSSKERSGGELWREGVKTGFGPGQAVIIKKPKARPAGKVPYSDETIHPNTLLFLKDLKGNNNREWLKSEYHPLTTYYGTPPPGHTMLRRLASLHKMRICIIERRRAHPGAIISLIATRNGLQWRNIFAFFATKLIKQQCTTPISAKVRRTGFRLWKS
jgi:hypothetical protein